MTLLTISNLYKSYRDLEILKDINLQVKEGERHVIIGPNGAGKTTLFNCITGHSTIDQGEITFDHKKIYHMPHYRLNHLGISRTFQHNNLFDHLTVEENIELAMMSKKTYSYQLFKPLKKYEDLKKEKKKLLSEWDIYDRKDKMVKELSYGEQRILEIMLSMASKPRLLLLDEPTSGMSPSETKSTAELIKGLPRSVTLLIIEHDMEVVFSIADKITVLHHGKLIVSGSPDEIREDEYVREIYFGGGALTGA